MNRCVRILSLVVVLAVPARGARAHELWLAPSSYRAAAGDTVALGTFVGTGFRGEPRPFVPSRVTAEERGTPVAHVSTFVPIELPAAEFESYLALEGLDAVRRARAAAGSSAAPGRERYRRACRTWIAGRSPEVPPARATTAFGLPLEIVPLGEPGRDPVLTIEVRFEGRPLAGTLVRAWRQGLADEGRGVPRNAAARDSIGPAIEARSDARGRVTLRLGAGAAEWLVSTVHMVASRDREAAEWESTWASLTFARTRGEVAAR